jgi:hypothetical protein
MIPFSSNLVTRLPFILGLVTPQQVIAYSSEVVVTVISQPEVLVVDVAQVEVSVQDFGV